MSKTATSAPLFLGEHRHALDEKNRVTMPAKWRSFCTGGVIVFKNPRKNCLNVMSQEAFEQVGESAREKIPSKDLQDFMRTLSSDAHQVTPDGQGRLLLVEGHCKKLGLRDEVWVVGVYKHIEIWSLADWKTFKETQQPNNEKLAELIGL